MKPTKQNTRKRKKDGSLWILLGALLCIAVLVLLPGVNRMQQAAYPQKYSDYVTYYADKYQIDPMILYAVIRTESGFDPQAQSGVDARGLMQITEETFDWIKTKIAPDEALVFEDLYQPETNIRFGSFYFTSCLQRYNGDLPTAAAAYHSGWGTVDRLLKDSKYSDNGQTLQVFPYTQMERYVEKITNSYSNYQEIYKE